MSYRVWDSASGHVFETLDEACAYEIAHRTRTGDFVAVTESRRTPSHTYLAPIVCGGAVKGSRELRRTVSRIYQCFDWDSEFLGTVCAVSIADALRKGTCRFGDSFAGSRIDA